MVLTPSQVSSQDNEAFGGKKVGDDADARVYTLLSAAA